MKMSESGFVSRNGFVYSTHVDSKADAAAVRIQMPNCWGQRPSVVTAMQNGCRTKLDWHSPKHVLTQNGSVIMSTNNGSNSSKVNTNSEIASEYREPCRYNEQCGTSVRVLADDRVTTSPDSTETVAPEDPVNAKDRSAVNEGDETETKIEVSETKPSMSYIGLISKAILQSPDRRMNLGAIYTWMETNFPYFQKSSRGWRNSVRHNLSLNDCFIKAGRCEDGKGNYWTISPENLEDFIRGDFRLRRRTRRRGRKADNGPTEILLKTPPYSTIAPPTSPIFVSSNMLNQSPYSHSQPYALSDPSANYSPAYNVPYQLYEAAASVTSPHGSPIPSLPSYAPWHQQPNDAYVECFQPGGPSTGYGNNMNHFYGYKNYSYPPYGYQTQQW